MKREELINFGICILIGFLLYSFIQNGLCGKKDLLEGMCWGCWNPNNVGASCAYDSDCNGWTGVNMKCLTDPSLALPRDKDGNPKNACYGTCVRAPDWDTVITYIRNGDEAAPGPGGGCGLPKYGSDS